MVFLAEASPLAGSLGSGSGFNIWQSLGGLILVFGLLILSLKLLGRFNRNHNPGQTSILTVWHLGPKREIQVLRLADEVHYIYRYEGAMVLLKQETLKQWEEFKAKTPVDQPKTGLAGIFPGGFTLSSLIRKPGNPVSTTPMPARVGDLLQSMKS